jgi:predicted outer membrane protein
MPAPQYFAMASRGGMFLEETARTAFEKTRNPSVKRFSRAEVVEQVSLTDKMAARGAPMMAAGAPPGGVVGGLVAAPFAVAGAAVGAAGAVAGGVLGAPAAMTTDAQKAQMVSQLQSMPAGPDFDVMFVRAQIMGHEEALQVHGSYAQAGDDPELRRVARSAVPLIRLHLSQLRRMERGMGGPAAS